MGCCDSPFLPDLTPCATPLLTQADANCLQTYLPSATQQQQHSLDPTQIQQLIQLAQQLKFEIGSLYSIEWVFCQDNNSKSQLYVTQDPFHRQDLR